MVQAYILIQTEVGKAANVAKAIAAISGVTMAEDVTGPYDVIARVEASNVDDLGRARHRQAPGRARHHPHAHVHGRPRLRPRCDTPSRRRRSASPSRCSVAAHGLPRWRSHQRRGLRSAPRRSGPRPSPRQAQVATDPGLGLGRGLGRSGRHRALRARPPRTDDATTASAVDGVDWVVRPLSDGSVATTYGRDPAIEVLAPAAYGPVPLLLPAFTAVASSLPANGRACS